MPWIGVLPLLLHLLSAWPMRCPAHLSPPHQVAYDEQCVQDIFRSFAQEAAHVLLFLKSVCKVELSVWSQGSPRPQVSTATATALPCHTSAASGT